MWQGAGSDREDCIADRGSAATDARTSSVAFRRNWHQLQESDTGYRGLRALEENLAGDLVGMDIGEVNKGKGQPKGKGKSNGKGKNDEGKGQTKDQGAGKGKGKGKSRQTKNNEISKSDRRCFVGGKTRHFAKDCDRHVRTVNEVTETTPVSTPVSVITEPGHC